MLKINKTELPEVLIFETDLFRDERGFFAEIHNQPKYAAAGLADRFVQDNHSRSVRNVLRGLHYQLQRPQGKLISVIRGEIFDVVVDIRVGSPTFARWVGVTLSEENRRQLWVPPGFAHGFCVLSEVADVLYKCTDIFVPGDDHGILWSDPQIGINWPIATPVLSPKDALNAQIKNMAEKLPRF